MNGYEKVLRTRREIEAEIIGTKQLLSHTKARALEIGAKQIEPGLSGLKCDFMERLEFEIDMLRKRLHELRAELDATEE